MRLFSVFYFWFVLSEKHCLEMEFALAKALQAFCFKISGSRPKISQAYDMIREVLLEQLGEKQKLAQNYPLEVNQ